MHTSIPMTGTAGPLSQMSWGTALLTRVRREFINTKCLHKKFERYSLNGKEKITSRNKKIMKKKISLIRINHVVKVVDQSHT